MKKAAIQLPSSTWTVTYQLNNDGTITVLDFNNEDQEGYLNSDQIGKIEGFGEGDEGHGHVLQTLTIDGTVYDVANKQNLFSYKAPL